MSADDARTFLESVMGYADQPNGEVASEDRPVKLGTVDALYTGSGNPKVLFDGESLMGVRTYPWVGRQPRPLDRVVLVPQGHTYVIVGTIGTTPGSDMPVGSYLEGAWTSAPAGFLMCDGAVVTRATYALLFAVIGTTYNTGGETGSQFRLPDSRKRGTIHKGASGTLSTLGATGGEEAHTQTIAELATHTHPMTQTFVAAGGVGVSAITYSATSSSTGPAGSSTPFNVLDPYLIVNRAIKF